ncbi:MAG: TolC family protein [Deltaproteobacteria bacterium]|nr:TolC family protein [Deltaproteobacteria bacterium]
MNRSIVTDNGRGTGYLLRVALAFLCFEFLTELPALAQTDDTHTISLSIEDAVMQSLENNETFLLQKLQPIRTGAFEQLEKGAYDPALILDAAHSRAKATEVSRSTGQQFDVELHQTDIEAGIEQQTPLGTSVRATVSSAREDSSRTTVQYSARLGMSVTQQLLQGRGPAVNLARLHQAELNSRISQHELAGYAEALVGEVEIAYWEYVSAALSIAAVEKSLDVARAKLDDIQERISVGALPENDAAAAAAEVGMREQTLLEARQLETDKKLTLLQLITPGTAPPPDARVKATTGMDLPDGQTDSIDAHVALALHSRQELAEAKLRQKKGDLEVRVTRNGVLPRLELFIDLGKTGYAAAFGESFSNLGASTFDATAGIRFRHVLGNRTAKAQHTIATVDATVEKQAMKNLQHMVTYDVHHAWHALKSAKALLKITTQTHFYRETALDSILAKFDAGSATQLAVVQAERDLLDSELEEVQAKVQYRIALVKLYLADGTLLKRRGISLE